MSEQYHIERMNQEEVRLAVSWAAKEGWNPGLYDADCFYQTDPQGFFAGKLNGQTIAVGSAVIYDEYFAFCGFYIVAEPYRDQGYGLELTRARLAYIGHRNAGIDGVIPMLDKYARLGYQFAHNNARYRLEKMPHQIISNAYIIPIAQIDFSQLCDYDRLHFPASRPQFLKCWIQQKQSMSLGFVQEKQLKGYGVIRTCQYGYKIGPLFADTPEIANILFYQLAQYAQGNVIFLDIPENNPLAIELVKHYKMTKVFATARMYLKEEPQLAKKQIFGITSFELG
ncbi:GNAT family N-acetyltransferase [Legionella maioricensis]|uniref:GNAT family N-acetyltransferase n=1 Tax=Legionella maioricensis TaxID=2896528 RepID=A0A9X2IDS1_9GAMM|nr:GNAT family N-acetyltransferase [Legionella maioricensis]MCL9685073.1 GNAT family N-acetyltransferase [Legionella maioricensis]MCL9688166.1 GNAT family N-acetyltransferase [Legionella maioricensis]